MTEMPATMASELADLGIVEPPRVSSHAPVAWPEKRVASKDMPFRMPELDENGEPPF